MLTNSFFWQALIFSGIAIGLVVGSAWWLYLSPISAPVGKVKRPTTNQSVAVALLLGLAGFQFVAGALWDASQHVLTGQVPGGADFLWPPHIMIYSAFVITLLIALFTIRTVAVPARRAGVNDPRQWVRGNPYLGAVALASLYGIFSIPGDAIWHALFGIDLTAWSPPHVLLAVMTTVVIVSAAALLAQGRPALSKAWANFAVATLLAIGLNLIYIVGVLEWELPSTLSDFVVSNPIWLYPVVGGTLAFIVLVLARRLVDWRWAATLTAGLFFAIRLIITIALGLTEQVMPDFPLLFLVGAFVLDWLPWDQLTNPWLRNTLLTLAYTLAFVFVALPVLDSQPSLPVLTPYDWVMATIVTFVVCWLLFPGVQWAGDRLNWTTAPTPAEAKHQSQKAASAP